MSEQDEVEQLRTAAQTRTFIDESLTQLFAPEDDALRAAIAALKEHDMPAIQISPLQGRLLQVLAAACGARKILEIGALSGYSGIWLARGLPPGGRLISLELEEKHAQVARQSLERAGVADRAEVRAGRAIDLLPALSAEAPFDLVFIDADKPSYPAYLDWAMRLTRPGSIIVADNCIRSGEPFRDDMGASASNTPVSSYNQSAAATNRAIAEYDRSVASNPRLRSVAFPMDDDGMDGFAISVVLP